MPSLSTITFRTYPPPSLSNVFFPIRPAVQVVFRSRHWGNHSYLAADSVGPEVEGGAAVLWSPLEAARRGLPPSTDRLHAVRPGGDEVRRRSVFDYVRPSLGEVDS